MKATLRKYLPLLLITAAILLVDQLTKYWVRSTLELGEVWMPIEWLRPYFRIVHWANTGVAFGLFQGKGIFFSILSAIVVVVILYYYPRIPQKDWVLRTALTLQFAGAIGNNLIDRLTLGYVTDFIWLGPIPVFNVADMCITLGVVVLLLGIYIQDREDRRNQPLETVEENPPHGQTEGEG